MAKSGVRIFSVAVYVTGIVLLSLHLPYGIPDNYRVWVVPIYAVLGALWLVDLFTRRIVLGADSIRIISIFDYINRTIPRAEIKSVTWEAGCGASLILNEGQGVRLPNVGRNLQGLTNTIRAWLRRTEA